MPGWTAAPSTSCALSKPRKRSLRRAEHLQRAVDAVASTRARVEEITVFFASYDDEEQRCRDEIAAAEAVVQHRQDEVAAAERGAAAARDDEERDRAERAVARAADHLSVAALRLERAHADLEQLERAAVELQQELPELEARAAAVSRAEDLPAPGRGQRSSSTGRHRPVRSSSSPPDR